MRLGKVNWLVIFACFLLVLEFVLADSPDGAAASSCDKDPSERMKQSVLDNYSTSLECARQCRKGEPPKICYYKFTLESYVILGDACQLCTPDNTNQLNATCQCVTADGVQRTLLTVNRMLPGPTIQVCKDDTIVVDVKNHIDGMGVSIHWHGVFQKNSQYYDGVPFITQCPILQGNTFRYEFLAGNEGTHFWHAHTGLHKMDGIYGSLIIRQPPRDDPNSKLYDEDSFTHVTVVSDWMHEQSSSKFPGLTTGKIGQRPDSILINGRGRYTDPDTNVSTTTPYEVFTVKRGKRYRFRFINAFCTVCPAQFVCEKHNLTLIALDGIAIKPHDVTSVISYAGERFDFVITANKPVRSYWIQVRGLGECAERGVHQLAILQYEDQPTLPTSVPPTYTQNLPLGRVLGPPDGLCNITRPDAICISQLKSATPVDKELISGKPCLTVYFALGFTFFEPNEIFQPQTYQPFLDPGGSSIVATVNNITFHYPASPPLSQYGDIPADQWCPANKTAANCGSCTQVVHVPCNCVMEIVMADGMGLGDLSHPIHFHGHAFKVIGMGKSPQPNVTMMSVKHAMELDAKKQLHRNKDRPPSKDTVAIPTGGYVIARVLTDNPGFWLMHCHFVYHILIGMELVIHVGEPKHLPPVPPHFPKCGNFLPPIGYKKYHQKSQYN